MLNIVIILIGEKIDGLYASRVLSGMPYFLSFHVVGGPRLVIVTLPGLFIYFFFEM